MPTVAIVGRPNVGKSALFNRLAGRRISIVHDQPGVTRDRISAPAKATATPCTLIDTGGISGTIDDGFEEQVTVEAGVAMETADLILFVVDAQDGLTPSDEMIARMLRKASPPVKLIINKVDDSKHESAFSDFTKLGMTEPILISAEHGRNFDALCSFIDTLVSPLAEEAEVASQYAEKVGIKLAIVGKPNAGKSSLVNAILHDKRTIVSDIAGTTRDAVDLPYQFHDDNFTLIDTAGLRPRGKQTDSIEVFSSMRTTKAIRRCDLCVLVVDLSSGISAQDRKIARSIIDEKKPCLVVLNKFDLYEPLMPEKPRLKKAKEHFHRELFFLKEYPLIVCSAKTGSSVSRILSKAITIRNAARTLPGTGSLNRILQEAMEVNPPAFDKGSKRRLKLYYATCAVNEKYSTIPVPTIVLFVNDKRLMSSAYQTYLSNRYREAHPAPGIPVIFSMRSRRRRECPPRQAQSN